MHCIKRLARYRCMVTQQGRSLAGISALYSAWEGSSFTMKQLSGKRRSAEANGDGFRLEDFLPYRLSVASSSVSRLFARHYSAAFDLSIPEWRVIAVIGRFGMLSPSAVGE